jgi:pSer/pThr/pTyr-binding forkhead associated (FHA) protein
MTINGDTVNQHTGSSAVADEAGTLELQGLPRDSAVLVVRRGPNAGSWFSLNLPVMSAGRHPNSDIFLDDISVSRHHAEFRRDSGQIRVVDVGSLNGIYVNDEAVDSVVLTNGDEIRMGNFRLVYLTHAPRVDSYDIDDIH